MIIVKCNATSLAGAQTEAQEAVIRKHFSTVRVMGHRLPGGVVGSSCLEIFKTHLDVVLGNLLLVVLLEPGGSGQIP